MDLFIQYGSGGRIGISKAHSAPWAMSGAGVIFLFSLLAKWLIILFAYLLTGGMPGGPASMLTSVLQFNFGDEEEEEDEDKVTRMYQDNPMLEELQRVLEGK